MHFWAQMGEGYRFRMSRPSFLTAQVHSSSWILESDEHRFSLKPNSPRAFNPALNGILQFENVISIRLARIDQCQRMLR